MVTGRQLVCWSFDAENDLVRRAGLDRQPASLALPTRSNHDPFPRSLDGRRPRRARFATRSSWRNPLFVARLGSPRVRRESPLDARRREPLVTRPGISVAVLGFLVGEIERLPGEGPRPSLRGVLRRAYLANACKRFGDPLAVIPMLPEGEETYSGPGDALRECSGPLERGVHSRLSLTIWTAFARQFCLSFSSFCLIIFRNLRFPSICCVVAHQEAAGGRPEAPRPGYGAMADTHRGYHHM